MNGKAIVWLRNVLAHEDNLDYGSIRSINDAIEEITQNDKTLTQVNKQLDRYHEAFHFIQDNSHDHCQPYMICVPKDKWREFEEKVK